MINRILIRFNNKFAEDPKGRTWRVLSDGSETLASKVLINVPGESISETIASGELKHHILCYGTVIWNGDVATIN